MMERAKAEGAKHGKGTIILLKGNPATEAAVTSPDGDIYMKLSVGDNPHDCKVVEWTPGDKKGKTSPAKKKVKTTRI